MEPIIISSYLMFLYDVNLIKSKFAFCALFFFKMGLRGPKNHHGTVILLGSRAAKKERKVKTLEKYLSC